MPEQKPVAAPPQPETSVSPAEQLSPAEETAFVAWQTLTYGMLESPYFLQPGKKKVDIARFTDQYRQDADAVRKSLSKTPVQLAFLPEELHQVKDATRRQVGQRTVRKELDMTRLEQLARKAEGNDDDDRTGQPDEIEDDNDANADEFQEDDDEGDDYLQDYYDEDYDAAGDDEENQNDY